MNNSTNPFLTVIGGFVFGAVIGGFIAAALASVLLTTTMTAAHPMGDKATGLGAVVLIPVPFGVVIGAFVGVNKAIKHLAPPKDD